MSKSDMPLTIDSIYEKYSHAIEIKNRADITCRSLLKRIGNIFDTDIWIELLQEMCDPFSEKWLEYDKKGNIIQYPKNGKIWFCAPITHNLNFEPTDSTLMVSYDALVENNDDELYADFLKSNISIINRFLRKYEKELEAKIKAIENDPHFSYHALTSIKPLKEKLTKINELQDNLFPVIIKEAAHLLQ